MDIPPYVVLEKKAGETPLQAIKAWKSEHPEYAEAPASYAGRLDPMASGKLLILLGEECKNRDAYLGLDKEYEVEVVLDLDTDSKDALGLGTYAGVETHPEADALSAALASLSGPHTVPYPAFSSKTVNGKPLFYHALMGSIASIQIPEHVETIYAIELLKREDVAATELEARIALGLREVPRVERSDRFLGWDFRQHDVRARWSEVFGAMPDRTFSVLTLRVTCASGTYMRSLAARLGTSFGTTAFALSIHRAKIGRYVPNTEEGGEWTTVYE